PDRSGQPVERKPGWRRHDLEQRPVGFPAPVPEHDPASRPQVEGHDLGSEPAGELLRPGDGRPDLPAADGVDRPLLDASPGIHPTPPDATERLRFYTIQAILATIELH